MNGWTEAILTGAAAMLVGIAYNIFLEVRSIRRMMNSDRRIPNEVSSYRDDA